MYQLSSGKAAIVDVATEAPAGIAQHKPLAGRHRVISGGGRVIGRAIATASISARRIVIAGGEVV